MIGWDISTGERYNSLLNEKEIFTNSITKTVLTIFRAFLNVLSGPADCFELCVDNDMIVSTSDRVVVTWEMFTNQPSTVLISFDMWVAALQVNENLIVAGSNDGILKILDFTPKAETYRRKRKMVSKKLITKILHKIAHKNSSSTL